MTRAEILNCLMDRPCEVCKFHSDGHCSAWNCVFEEKPDDAEQKMGRWILLSDKDLNGPFDFVYKGNAWMNYECSNCGHKVHNGLNDTLLDNRTNYCPNCGAKMAESED